jgi:hypothetical protein
MSNHACLTASSGEDYIFAAMPVEVDRSSSRSYTAFHSQIEATESMTNTPLRHGIPCFIRRLLHLKQFCTCLPVDSTWGSQLQKQFRGVLKLTRNALRSGRRYVRYFVLLLYLTALFLAIYSCFFRGLDPNRDEISLLRPYFFKINEMKKLSKYGFKYDLYLYRELDDELGGMADPLTLQVA